ncbi:MAG: nitroreductase family protein [Methanomicrobiales archaeon]
METTEFYSTIFKRKSVRNYDPNPLEQEVIEKVNNFIESLIPLFHDIKTEVKIIQGDQVKSFIPQKKAPHYIAVFSQEKEGYLTNIGYMMQQMDLFLSSQGLGSCWQGIPKPVKTVINSSSLKFVIVMAFGPPKETLHRTDISQFKRKPLKEITSINGKEKLLEPVRLAPSATNSQPWYFTGDDQLIHAYCKKLNFLKAKLLAKWNKIDMGIALYHLKVSANHQGQKVEIYHDQDAEDNSPDGYYYTASVKIF